MTMGRAANGLASGKSEFISEVSDEKPALRVSHKPEAQ